MITARRKGQASGQTYLAIGNCLAVLVLIDNHRLLVDSFRQRCLSQLLRGAALLNSPSQAEATLLVCVM